MTESGTAFIGFKSSCRCELKLLNVTIPNLVKSKYFPIAGNYTKHSTCTQLHFNVHKNVKQSQPEPEILMCKHKITATQKSNLSEGSRHAHLNFRNYIDSMKTQSENRKNSF